VRWKSDNSEDQYKYADVVEVEDAGDASFTIIGLKQNTQYQVAVRSRNDEHGETEYSTSLQARTAHASDDADGFDGYHTIRAVGYSRSNSLFIIVAACVIGGVVIVINIIVITYIIRKKQTHGGSVPVIPLSKLHHVPVEKTYQGGSKYDSQYCCDDPNHRHTYGDHFYMPDPLLVGETAQLNPVYGYVPIGDTLCQSAYMPTLYTSDANYQQVHQTHLPEFQSPLTPVRPVDSRNTLPSTAKYMRMAPNRYEKKSSKPSVHQRGGLRKRQSFGDSLNRLSTSSRRMNQLPSYHSDSLQRATSINQYFMPSYNLVPVNGQQHDNGSGGKDERSVKADLLGYTETCYIDQLEALQSGNSPTKRLLLNGNAPNGTLKRNRANSSWNDAPDVVV
ncbi:hypothetical protein ACTXT7_015091, partial [Hymenolepis weldensis]